MRKGFEGLYGLVRERLSCEPLSGHLFLFCNAQRNRLKVLVWDGSGLWVCAKRLAKGRFSWPQSGDAQGKVVLSHERALSIIGWDRSGPDQAQAVVPGDSPRRTCCCINCLYVEIDSVKSLPIVSGTPIPSAPADLELIAQLKSRLQYSLFDFAFHLMNTAFNLILRTGVHLFPSCR